MPMICPSLKRLYLQEMSDADHEKLLELLDAYPGPVLLSGYPNPLCDERLKYWKRLEASASAEGDRKRIEVL